MQAPGYFRYDMFSQGIFVDPMAPVQRLQNMAERIVPLTSSFPLIRLGANTDGGYLVPDDLSNINDLPPFAIPLISWKSGLRLI